MNQLSKSFIKNHILYYIAAGLICFEGLLCANQITSGARLMQSASYGMMWGEGPSAGMVAWGLATVITGVFALAGFLVSGIGAFIKQKLVFGAGLCVLALSYILAILREGIGAVVYGGIGFLFLNLIGLALLVLMVIATFAEVLQVKRFVTEYTPLAMLVPMGLFVLTVIVAALGWGLSAGTFFYNLFENLAQSGIILIIAAFITGETEAVRQKGEQQVRQEDGYRSVLAVVVLGVVTFGIYLWYWVYKTSEKLNRELMTGKSAGVQTVLFIFIPFYSWYWVYTMTQNLNEYSLRRGRPADSAMAPVNLIATIVGLLIVAVAIMQDMMNKAVIGVPGAGYAGASYTAAGASYGTPAGSRDAGSRDDESAQARHQASERPSHAGDGATHVGAGYFYAGGAQTDGQYEADASGEAAPYAAFEERESRDEDFEMVDKGEPEAETPDFAVSGEPEEYEVASQEEPLFDDSVFDLVSELEAEQRSEQAFSPADDYKADAMDQPEPAFESDSMPYEELKKLKQLLDEEIITQEEFDTLKKKFI